MLGTNAISAIVVACLFAGLRLAQSKLVRDATPLSGSKPQSDAERVTIAGIRRVSFIIVFAPIICVVAFGLYILAQEAVSGFPDRRPVMLFYTFGFFIFLPPSVRIIFWVVNRIFLARAPALFIEDGYLIYISKDYFCIPVKDAEVALTPSDNLFRKVILSVKNGRRTEIGLFVFDKSGSEIIDAVKAYRLQRSEAIA